MSQTESVLQSSLYGSLISIVERLIGAHANMAGVSESHWEAREDKFKRFGIDIAVTYDLRSRYTKNYYYRLIAEISHEGNETIKIVVLSPSKAAKSAISKEMVRAEAEIFDYLKSTGDITSSGIFSDPKSRIPYSYAVTVNMKNLEKREQAT